MSHSEDHLSRSTEPFPAINVHFQNESGEYLLDNGSKNLGSFIQDTNNIFSLFIHNKGGTGTILTIPQNGITLDTGSSGIILDNMSDNDLIDIPQGRSPTEIIIKFDSLVIGNKNIKILIGSNDPSNPLYQYTFFFTVTAPSALNPDIAIVYNNSQILTSSVIYLGSFPQGGISDISFQIFNYATPNLVIPNNGINITTISSNESLIVNPSASNPIILLFNTSSIFKIRLDNSSIGNKSAVILITSNDPDENPFVFTVSYYVAKPFNLIIKESSVEVSDGENISLGSFNQKSIINRNINMSNNGISYGIKILNIFGEGDVTLTSMPSLPYVIQPNGANSFQFIAKFGSSVIGRRIASLKIQWEVSAS